MILFTQSGNEVTQYFTDGSFSSHYHDTVADAEEDFRNLVSEVANKNHWFHELCEFKTVCVQMFFNKAGDPKAQCFYGHGGHASFRLIEE